MSVTLVNNHVLLPHAADWSNDPDWQRAWQTDIVAGITGPEARAAGRAAPRRSLGFEVSALSLVEQGQFDDRVRAAKKLGKACAPHWGLASVLSAQVNATAVLLVDTAWTWAAGDYVFFWDGTNYEVGQISVLNSQTNFTLAQPVSRAYAAGLQVWPMLFGKFTADTMAAVVSQRGQARLNITELTSHDSAQIGALAPPAGTGIGVFIIGSTFIVA